MPRRITRFGSERAVRLFLRSNPSVRRGSVQCWYAHDNQGRLAIVIPAKVAPRAVDRTKLRRVIREIVQGIAKPPLQASSLCVRVIGGSESVASDLRELFVKSL